MTAIAHQLPQPIVTYLSRFSWRRRAQRLMRALGLVALFSIVWAATWCAVDRLVALPASVRLAGPCVNGAAAAVLIARPIGEMVRRRDWVALARQVETRDKRWQERLWTVTSRTFGPARFRGSAELLGALMDEVSREAQVADARGLLPWRRVARPWLV